MTHAESTPTAPWGSWAYRGALVAIVLLASVLRFEQIDRVGIRFDDESAYAFDARLWHRCGRLALDPQAIGAAFTLDKAVLQRRMGAVGIDFGDRYLKPSQGFTFLGALVMFITGEGPVALLVLNALCGTLSVLVLAALGANLFGRGVGLFAALILTVSPYHLVYCRSAFPYATAGFFVLLGVWWWDRLREERSSPRRLAVLAGAALGVATMCHYSAGYIFALCLVFEALRRPSVSTSNTTSSAAPRLRTRRCGLLAAGWLMPILATEVAFQGVRLAARITDSYLPLASFMQAAWYWVAMIRSCVVQAPDAGLVAWRVPVAYAAFFVHWQASIVSALVLAGLVLSWRWRGTARFPATVVVSTVMLLSLQRFTIARAAATTVPFACLCAGLAACTVMTSVGRRSGRLGVSVGVVLTLAIVTVGLVGSSGLMGARSDIERACLFLNEAGGALAVPPDSGTKSKYAHYLDPATTTVLHYKLHGMGTPGDVIAELKRDGVRWVVADPQHWHFRDPETHPEDIVFRWWRSFYERVEEEAVLTAVFPHIGDHRWEFLAEGPGLRFLAEMTEEQEGSLRIYDLQARREVVAAPVPPEPHVKYVVRKHAG